MGATRCSIDISKWLEYLLLVVGKTLFQAKAYLDFQGGAKIKQ